MKQIKPIYVALILVVIAAAGMVFINRDDTEQQEIAESNEKPDSIYVEQNQDEERQEDKLAADDFRDIPEELDFVADKTEEVPEEENHEEESAASEVSVPVFSFSEGQTLQWPAKGNVILPYSMEQTVYFATLDQYKYNPAIIIQADVNTDIIAAATGTVTEIYNHEETGKTVRIDIGSGYETIYGNCKDLQVEVGDIVRVGQRIACVAESTKYYVVEGSNLYFKLMLDGEPINPILYFQD